MSFLKHCLPSLTSLKPPYFGFLLSLLEAASCPLIKFFNFLEGVLQALFFSHYTLHGQAHLFLYCSLSYHLQTSPHNSVVLQRDLCIQLAISSWLCQRYLKINTFESHIQVFSSSIACFDTSNQTSSQARNLETVLELFC